MSGWHRVEYLPRNVAPCLVNCWLGQHCNIATEKNLNHCFQLETSSQYQQLPCQKIMWGNPNIKVNSQNLERCNRLGNFGAIHLGPVFSSQVKSVGPNFGCTILGGKLEGQHFKTEILGPYGVLKELVLRELEAKLNPQCHIKVRMISDASIKYKSDKSFTVMTDW